MNPFLNVILFGLGMVIIYTVHDIFSQKKIRRIKKEMADYRARMARKPSPPSEEAPAPLPPPVLSPPGPL
ncbi:MAG: hypothetical protein LBT40_12190 [Deltaproteobacteria bacterium]|jgi:hypothetical protein|nr:hypothetical protein [Deltaproteobacteria bacterium]